MHKKKENSPFQVCKKSLGYLWKGIYEYRPSYYYVYAIDIILRTIQPFINILFPKKIIDELLGARDIKTLAIITGVMILSNILVQYLLAVTNEILSKEYNDNFTRYFDNLLGRKIMKMDFQNTESKEVLDRAEKAKNGMSWSGGISGINGELTSVISSFLTLVGIIGIMITGPWPVLLLVTLNIIISGCMNKKNNMITRKYFGSFSELNRPFSYLFYKLSDIRYAKDIRLYAADPMMLEKADAYNRNIVGVFHKQSSETIKYHAGISLAKILRNGLSFLYLGYQVIGRWITIGEFTMYINAGDSFGNSGEAIVRSIQNLVQKSYFLYEYVTFMELPDHKANGELRIQNLQGHTIEFHHVSFHYPQSETMVLDDVNITVKNGEHLAIVGLNGAGKTTFVKLLCRLYDVSEGEILLDGININEYIFEDYIKLLSVVFQDFKLFAFSALENILTTEEKEYDKERLEVILNQVNLKKKFESLPNGIQTNMYRYFDTEGVELSGGEQQKLAIARALYKDASIVILDEPTAALDPKAESEIYKQFHQLIGHKTAFYISHRLSSCKFCDKIAVFSEGTIKEYGTHEELMAIANGIYAELFHVQAQYYQA